MIFNKINSLRKHQGFTKYFKNTAWVIGEKILRLVVGLFIGIWVARYLGLEQYGLFSYVLSFVGLFASISNLGLDGVVVRELVRNKNNKKTYLILGTAFELKLYGAVLALILIGIAIQFTTNNSYTITLILIAVSATIFQSFNVIDIYFQSKVLSKYVVYSNIITLLFSSIIKITLIKNEAPLIYFAWVVLFDTVILVCSYLYFYYQNNLSFNRWLFDKKTAKNLLISGIPLMLSGFFVAIYMKIDQVMIKEMLNSEAVGQYAAAAKLSEAWYFIPVTISASLFPAIINAKIQNKNLYFSRIQYLYDFMVYIGILIALLIFFLGNWLVDLLYGVQFNKAGDVLIVHIWAGIFVGLLVASGKWIINENLNRHALYRNICGAIINITLNYFWIKTYGIIGAAYATLISYSFSGFGYDFFSPKLRPTFYLKVNALTFKTARTYLSNYIKEKK